MSSCHSWREEIERFICWDIGLGISVYVLCVCVCVCARTMRFSWISELNLTRVYPWVCRILGLSSSSLRLRTAGWERRGPLCHCTPRERGRESEGERERELVMIEELRFVTTLSDNRPYLHPTHPNQKTCPPKCQQAFLLLCKFKKKFLM